MDRRLLLLVVAVVALVGVVNATVYAYRWIQGTVTIAGPGQATGAACTGFYSSTEQGIPNTYLPEVGKNYNAPTYGTNTITVTPGNVVCTFDSYNLYESIEVTIPITVGSWYIQDFYGFGYYRGTGSVYVYFRVDETNLSSLLTTAYLIIRDTRGGEIARLNLLELGNQTSTAIELSSGSGLRLDLYFDASDTGTVSFKVGVYVTQEPSEAPTIGTSP